MKQTLTIICQWCGEQFTKMNTRGACNYKFCSKECLNHKASQRKKRATSLNNQCLICQKPCHIKYCSVKCASIGKTKPRFCKKCNKSVPSNSRVCAECNFNLVDWSKVTIKELRGRLTTPKFHSRIRMLARNQYRKIHPNKSCNKCGYDIFTEICHIKSISEFDENTPISVVNDMSNLKQLCPNCHWEFDNEIM